MPRLTPRRCLVSLLAMLLLGSFSARSAGAGVPSAVTPRQGTLLIVGDSLTEGATLLGNLRALTVAKGPWKRVLIDYRRGRRASDAVSVVRSRLAADRTVTAVVLALGTNDMLSRGEAWYPRTVIDRLMSETRGLPVLWVNLSFEPRTRPVQRARGAVFNRDLESATGAWTTLRVADWNRAFVPRGASRFIVDGIHLTTSGYRTRASWTAARIAEFGTWTSDRTSTTTSTTTPTTSTTTSVSTTTTSSTTTSSTTSTSTSTSSTSPGS